MITKEEFENIATLARISKGEEEYLRFAEDLSRMVVFADKIKDVSTDDGDFFLVDRSAELREDRVEPSFERADILSNVSDSQDGYFLLRKRA